MKNLIILFLMLSFNSFSNDYIYQKCVKQQNRLICENINPNQISFNVVQKEDLKENHCFYKETDKNHVFFRINKIKGDLFFTFSQVINKKTNKWDETIYYEFLSWGGMNLNHKLTKINCNQTRNLKSLNYLRKKCGFHNQVKATLYCEREMRIRRVFGEREY